MEEVFRIEGVRFVPELRVPVAGGYVGHDQRVVREIKSVELNVTHSFVHETCRSDVCEPHDLLDGCHGVRQGAPHLPLDLLPLPGHLVQLVLDSLLDSRVARQKSEGPSHHDRLGLSSNDKYLPHYGGEVLRGEGVLPPVDPLQVGVLKVAGPVPPVVLPVFSDPLLSDLVEPVPVVSAPLYVGDGLWQYLGQDGHEGEDGCPGHELGHLVDAFVHRLELLLLGVQLSAAGHIPQDVEDPDIELVTDGHSLSFLLA